MPLPESTTSRSAAFRGQVTYNVGFSAMSDADGANPFGHLSQTIPHVRKDRFRVTCLAVSGNEAAIGLTPTDAQTAQNYPNGRVLAVRDNGNPANGQSVDEYAYFIGSIAADCANYVSGASFVPANGDVARPRRAVGSQRASQSQAGAAAVREPPPGG